METVDLAPLIHIPEGGWKYHPVMQIGNLLVVLPPTLILTIVDPAVLILEHVLPFQKSPDPQL